MKKELGDEVSYVSDQDTEIHTNKSRYASICKALGYSHEFFIKTRHLHSSNSSEHGFGANDDSYDADPTSRSSSYQTTRQSISRIRRHQRPTLADKARSGPSSNASYLSDTSQSGRHLLDDDDSPDDAAGSGPPSGPSSNASYLSDTSRPSRHLLDDDDSPDDAAGSGPPTGQSLASGRPKRTMPDRSAKPLGDPDVGRRREQPYVDPDTGELLVSTSLGASAPGTGSTKRPLPDSPTSLLQPDNTARRRQEAGDMRSREEMGSSSRSRKEHSHKQRGRA